MEVNLGPNPYDEPNLLYKLQRKVNVFSTSNPLPNRGYKLVASASKYGIVFVASPDGKLAVYYLNQLIDKECDLRCLSVQLQEKPTHIVVSCNNELLAVTGGQVLLVYRVTDFQNQNVSPSLSVRCDVNSSTFVSDLKWNPCIPDIIVITFFDGTLIMLQASNGQVKKVQSKARCLCWSPKGKQLVTGNSDGTLCQYKPDLTPIKTIPAPNLFEGSPVEALAIHWISTYQFAVVFRNAADNSRPAVTIVNTPKGGQPTCLNYEDVCYSMGTTRPWYYYLQGLPSWNVILCSSSNSMEMGTLGSLDSSTWSQWNQPDEARPELPLSKDQENYPVGLCFDTAAVHQLPWGENEKLSPMPLLLVVSQTGLLAIFNVINLVKGAPVLCAPTQPLTLPAAAMISGSVETAPSEPPAPTLAALQFQPAQPIKQLPQPPALTPIPQAQPTSTQPKPLAPTAQAQAKPAASLFGSRANKPLTAPPPLGTQAFGTGFEAKPTASQLFSSANTSKPFAVSQPSSTPAFGAGIAGKSTTSTAAQLFGSVNIANKPFTVPQPPSTQAFDSVSATRPQTELSLTSGGLPNVKPAVSQSAMALPKPDIVQNKATEEENAALKAEQENANRQKADQEFKNMVIQEVNEFQMELHKFITNTRTVQIKLHKEQQSINPNLELQKLDAQFIKRECSVDELWNAIAAQKLDLAMTNAFLADVRQQAEAKELDQWTQADPLTTKRVKSVKNLSYYIESQLEQANRQLEHNWYQQKERMTRKLGPAMIRPVLEDIYEVLVEQEKTLSGQQARVKTLKCALRECDDAPIFKSTSIIRTTPFKNKDRLLQLTKNILNMSIEPKNVEQKSSLTPQKLDALRDMLSKHKTVKIKPVNVEMRHHLSAMRIRYEKSEKEKAAQMKKKAQREREEKLRREEEQEAERARIKQEAELARIKQETELARIKQEVEAERARIQQEEALALSLISKPKVKYERASPLDQMTFTAIEPYQDSSFGQILNDSGPITEMVSSYKLEIERKSDQTSIENLVASPPQYTDPNSTGFITELIPHVRTKKSTSRNQSTRAIENASFENIETPQKQTSASNSSVGLVSDVVYDKTKPKPKRADQSILHTSVESIGDDTAEDSYTDSIDTSEHVPNQKTKTKSKSSRLQTSVESIDDSCEYSSNANSTVPETATRKPSTTNTPTVESGPRTSTVSDRLKAARQLSSSDQPPVKPTVSSTENAGTSEHVPNQKTEAKVEAKASIRQTSVASMDAGSYVHSSNDDGRVEETATRKLSTTNTPTVESGTSTSTVSDRLKAARQLSSSDQPPVKPTVSSTENAVSDRHIVTATRKLSTTHKPPAKPTVSTTENAAPTTEPPADQTRDASSAPSEEATAPNAVRTLFPGEPTPTAKQQALTQQPVFTMGMITDALKNIQVAIVPKKDDNGSYFMGQRICSPLDLDFSSVIVATPTSFTSKPVSELENVYNQFEPREYFDETNPNETGEPESTVTTKTDSDFKDLKTSTPQNLADRLALSKDITIKKVESKSKSDKVDDNSKENMSSDKAITITKVVKEEKNEPKPLAEQNTNKTPFSSKSQSTVTSSSATFPGEAAELDSENYEPTSKSEVLATSSSSIIASANATITVPKSIYGSSTVTSSDSVVTQSTTSAKPQSTSSAASIFATAVANVTAPTTGYNPIFGTPSLASPTTETGSIFNSTAPSGVSSGSIFGTSNTVTTVAEAEPTDSVVSNASSLFGSKAKAVFGSNFTATTTTPTSPAAFAPSPAYEGSGLVVVQYGTGSPTPESDQDSIEGSGLVVVEYGTGSPTPESEQDSNKGSGLVVVEYDTAEQDSAAAAAPLTFSTPAAEETFGAASSTMQLKVQYENASNQPSVFASSTSTPSSIFHSPTTTTAPVFGSQTTQATVFSQASVFGTQAQTNAAAVFALAAQSEFGSHQQNSLFGAPQTTSNYAQPSIFESGTATTQSSIFGSRAVTTQPLFGNSTATTQFGAPAQTSQAAIFGNSSQTSVFSAPATTANSMSMFDSEESLFNSVNISTTSAPTQGSQNIFSGSSSGTAFGNSAGNVFSRNATFGQATPQSANIFGGGASFGQSASPAPNLWANNNSGSEFGSTAFRQPTTQTSVFGTGSFSATTSAPAFSSPTQQSGGAFNSPAGLGSPSGAFGAPAAFGGLARGPGQAFGGAATFGGGASAEFGSPTQSNSTFESLANQNTLTFGNLAQQTPQQPQPPPSFDKSSSFGTWRG